MISSSTGPAGYCRVGRLALLGVDQTQPVDSLDHLGHPNLLDHRLGAPVGMDPDFSLATGCRRTSCSGALDRDIAPAPSGLGECSGLAFAASCQIVMARRSGFPPARLPRISQVAQCLRERASGAPGGNAVHSRL